MARKLKIACIGNYPPRECGIATFTRDVVNAVLGPRGKSIDAEAYIVALNDREQSYEYPDNVKFRVRQNDQRDYLEAAKFINHSDANVCLLQHEFGIFGGEGGLFILSLISRLKIPLITTLHTVLEKPSYSEKAIIQEICKKAAKVVIMSSYAAKLLKEVYHVSSSKIALMHHGVPKFDTSQGKKLKKKFHFEDKTILFTFGLLSRNKGIETVIHALPEVVKKHPNVLYVILGKTHPNVLRVADEEYRNYLLRLVERYNLKNNVQFLNRFVSNEELFEYLSAIDIYITPYLNKAQITSGSLAYAVGAGAAVVSTPYWHAEELLSEGRGQLFDFGDTKALSKILIGLSDNPTALNKYRKKAFAYGQKMAWSVIGKQYRKLLIQTIAKNKVIQKEKPVESIVNQQALPILSLDHIERMTDGTGIIQHSSFGVPNRHEGYALDDNSRALLMATMCFRQTENPISIKLIPIYLSFIHYMQRPEGDFRNFLSYDRRFLDEAGTEDAFGRTIWALGYFIRYTKIESYFQFAKDVFDKAASKIEQQKSIRAVANCIIGVSYYLNRFPGNDFFDNLLRTLTKKLVDSYKRESEENWKWFEEILAYDNAVLPLALLHSYKITKDEKTLDVAIEAMKFLEKVVFSDHYPSLVGNEHWYKKGGVRSQYAQQPIDAMALVLMYRQAYSVFKKPEYIRKMYASFNWFLGENDLRLPLYDYETKGCKDGLESYGASKNQGAESALAYLISHIAMLTINEVIVLQEST